MPLSLEWEKCDSRTAPVIAQHLYREWYEHSVNGVVFDDYLKNFNNQYDVNITYDFCTNRVTFNISPEKMLLLEIAL